MSDPLQDRAGDDVVFQGNVWWNGGACDREAAWHLDQGKAMCGGTEVCLGALTTGRQRVVEGRCA